mmetsp:Transcript_23782/g.47771  ORF Transcript_23782/g.47771 Transcript_23782/m.47771 type:complete len:257 (+) Transcript_23782:292-1062(+)
MRAGGKDHPSVGTGAAGDPGGPHAKRRVVSLFAAGAPRRCPLAVRHPPGRHQGADNAAAAGARRQRALPPLQGAGGGAGEAVCDRAAAGAVPLGAREHARRVPPGALCADGRGPDDVAGQRPPHRGDARRAERSQGGVRAVAGPAVRVHPDGGPPAADPGGGGLRREEGPGLAGQGRLLRPQASCWRVVVDVAAVAQRCRRQRPPPSRRHRLRDVPEIAACGGGGCLGVVPKLDGHPRPPSPVRCSSWQARRHDVR